MSKAGLFLLIAMMTGFASFQKAKATPVILSGAAFMADSCNVAGDTLHLLKDSIISKAETTVKDTSAKELRKKKIIYSLLSLPFPCGFVGAHRVMLGTNPWVPVVYVATFGGCFGLLPLIDFCFITFSKDITPYENNPHVFMWVK